jgi:hypothetical protein
MIFCKVHHAQGSIHQEFGVKLAARVPFILSPSFDLSPSVMRSFFIYISKMYSFDICFSTLDENKIVLYVHY